MTYEELKEIKQRLDKWREQRYLSYESQQKGFVPNILDELREYYLAKDDDERVAELCDIVIYCLNVKELEEFGLSNKRAASLRHLIDNLANMISTKYTGLELDFKSELALASIEGLIEVSIRIIQRMNYNPYECLKEKVKEIESRSGKYDESLGKFIKDFGTYTKEEAKELIISFYYAWEEDDIKYDKEDEDYFYFIITTENNRIEKIKKWHKAKMIKCLA
ncbi:MULTISPECIES: hypothetical protein [unclassified Campylobacter]|uniref:hypothetical protein n=1 Tax=unclassified Campylobacter TaxID=2593542 RepID=UPI001EFBBBA3|nr:hypothetical protein [Campylobacter sp. RM12651]MBZ7976730.1 hypothetical protein [Campylobacter sp. RM12637]ULO02901.1 hypothetical protein AVBRAN_0431 [Campylobacter sp. RM12651]